MKKVEKAEVGMVIKNNIEILFAVWSLNWIRTTQVHME
jgi:hypothetical protein